MRRKPKILLIFILLMLIIFSIGMIYILNQFNISELKVSATMQMVDGQPNLINIDECSEEFMEEYFEKTEELDELDNKENILIVTSKNGSFETYGATHVVEAPNHQYLLQYTTLEEKNEAFEALKTIEEIKVEENLIRTISDVETSEQFLLNDETNTTETVYNSWGIEATYLDYAIREADGKELNDVTVAILDTGCDMDLFNQNYPGRIEEVYNVLDSNTNAMYDYHGHGTHIAGTIAEGTPDNVKIIPVRVSEEGKLYLSDILEGINYIVYYDKADVINMSFGGYGRSEEEYQAIESANQKNIICVAAAGNDNSQAMHYPSSFDNTISIASVDSAFYKSNFSNYGSTITFAAPGSNILSINGYMSGTSMATPHAVCAVAILKSYNNAITLENTIDLLKDNAIDLGEEGFDKYFGNGLISFESAVFCDKNGCDGSECDEFCIFKKDKKPLAKIVGLEVIPVLTGYNYGSINNILMSEVRIIYDNGNELSTALHNLDNFNIIGYDPYATNTQNVTLTYEGITTTFEVANYENYLPGWEYVKLDENTIELTKYKSNRLGITKLYLPEKIDGYTVVSIAEYGISTPTSQKIWGDEVDALYFDTIIAPKTFNKIGSAPSNVEYFISEAPTIEIGTCAFYEVDSLKSFEGTIASLGEYAFYNCESLKELKLADTITEIPSCAFCGCIKLEKINIPDSINVIGNAAFFNTIIKEINIPEGVTVIEKETFAGCYALTDVTLPESLTEIKAHAFFTTNIIELSIPKNLVKIDNTAFMETVSLESIIVDEKNTVYDSRENCDALIETDSNKLILGSSRTYIPDSIKSIGEYSFYGNLGVYLLELPEGVEEIGEYAFFGSGLSLITLPRSLNIIGERAIDKYVTCLLYTDSYAATYVKENKITYEAINPSMMLVYRRKTEYNAFETVEYQDINNVELYHDRAYYIDGAYCEYTGARGRREDAIYYEIKYIDDRDSFRYGDTYFIVEATNQFDETFEKQVTVQVAKLIPTYTIPENLVAEEGTKLSDILLPNGFEWMDDTQITIGEWNEVYYARYIPDDTNNYEIIENIEIIINKKNKEVSNISVNLLKTEYIAFEKVDIQDLYITIEYTDGTTEKISTNLEIMYNNNNDSFRYGDTTFTIKGYSKMKELIEKEVEVIVKKAIPEYIIPTNIKASLNQTLSEIELPNGFSWKDKTQKLEEVGEFSFKATYTPEDTTNYEIIENIEITVVVMDVKCEEIYSPNEFFVFESDVLISDLGIYALPSNAINLDLIFEIEDENIAKIEDDKIIILKDGTTNLIVKTVDGTNIVKIIPITVDFPLPFVDISKSSWCYSAVKFVYKNGFILGTTPTTYEPASELSRGMIVTILWRIEGKEIIDGESIFPDVKENKYFYEAVKWASKNGIVSGYENGTFAPNKSVTREELAVILRNYTKKYRGIDTDSIKGDLTKFNDSTKISSYAVSAMEWAVGSGVITGFADDNTMRCYSTATRDVAASMIYKYFKNIN